MVGINSTAEIPSAFKYGIFSMHWSKVEGNQLSAL